VTRGSKSKAWVPKAAAGFLLFVFLLGVTREVVIEDSSTERVLYVGAGCVGSILLVFGLVSALSDHDDE